MLARVSAVKVFPTPGGPLFKISSRCAAAAMGNELEQENEPAAFAPHKVLELIIGSLGHIILGECLDSGLLHLGDLDVIERAFTPLHGVDIGDSKLNWDGSANTSSQRQAHVRYRFFSRLKPRIVALQMTSCSGVS